MFRPEDFDTIILTPEIAAEIANELLGYSVKGLVTGRLDNLGNPTHIHFLGLHDELPPKSTHKGMLIKWGPLGEPSERAKRSK